MYMVIFRNRKRAEMDQAAYGADLARMEELAASQPGYRSFRAYTHDDGEVVAVSEWDDEASARAWGQHAEHLVVQGKGRQAYYESYTLFACDNPRTHHFELKDQT